uniref:group II intron reverse transcriptase/maturase mat1 n=1 Tax=Phacus arnoldii TaxID=298292 RepID=UPI0023AB06FE|nr:group II intron reverse transcriptase/maturase mat1 [Phacus arnoldii]WCH63576.1 group II intron reverse transcriptase/maturase mat1 [Phacus arnoldii]
MLFVYYNEKLFTNWKMISWEKSRSNLLRLQKRLFKSVYVGDINKSLKIQKLIVFSNSARLLAIRAATQTGITKWVSGIDGKTSLTFLERFNLNQFLLVYANNWKPKKPKEILFSNNDSSCNRNIIFSISDRSWQYLIQFALEPAHEALFVPRSYGFRASYLIHNLQRVIYLNLNKSSHGLQKRVLIFDFPKLFNCINYNFLLDKIIAPRGIKLGIFRFLKIGLSPHFINEEKYVDNFPCLLANIFFNGIELLHNSVRYGSKLLIFLNPNDNEFLIKNKIIKFLDHIGLDNINIKVDLFSAALGFDFLDWHFRVYSKGSLFCTPSVQNYRLFLRRVKHIINNSNYALKLAPIVKEWKCYHRFCNLKNSRFSLFYVQKRAFKIFNKESKQDRYSSKKLLNKSFLSFNSNKLDLLNNNFSPYNCHVTFWCDYKIQSTFELQLLYVGFGKKNICIHCGMNIS